MERAKVSIPNDHPTIQPSNQPTNKARTNAAKLGPGHATKQLAVQLRVVIAS